MWAEIETRLERDELAELHYITPIDNVPSILARGLLSHRRVAKLQHRSIAMPELQDKRAKVMIPGGRPLHEYVNLYICARNPMMHRRKDHHLDLCVLRIDPAVLDLPGVVVSDSNAASGYARFAPAPDGLKIVDQNATFAEWWIDPDRIQYFRKAARKCAEVLVPDVAPATYVSGAYVSCEQSLETFGELQCGLAAVVDGHLFFR